MNRSEIAGIALTPYLQTLTAQLREIETKATVLRTLSREQWLWTPSANVWPLVLILDHVNATDKGALPRITQAIETLHQANRRSDGPFRYNGMERFFIRMLSPDPPFRMPVPGQFAPTLPTDPLADVYQPFLANLEQNLRLVEQANGYDLKAARITSPISPLVKMTVGAYLEANIAHKRYHWTQVESLLNHPNFPSQSVPSNSAAE